MRKTNMLLGGPGLDGYIFNADVLLKAIALLVVLPVAAILKTIYILADLFDAILGIGEYRNR